MDSNQPSFKEFSIPVPYGLIAAKAWGNEEGLPVLALHGWQDNLGTFERLVPLLSSSLYIVGFDAPGHGLSSHKPHGCFYHYMEMLVDIKRVADYLKWSKFFIIGHSLGGTLALLYASIYPKSVSGIITLDIIKPLSRYSTELPSFTRRGLEKLLQLESKLNMPTPVYSYEKARERLMEGTHQQVTSKSADILLKRSCKPSECGKGVVFTRDIRLKTIQDLQRLSHESTKAYLTNIKCDLLIILSEASEFYEQFNSDVIADIISIYEKNCNSFVLKRVAGDHYVHLNQPDNVAPLINDFFHVHSRL